MLRWLLKARTPEGTCLRRVVLRAISNFLKAFARSQASFCLRCRLRMHLRQVSLLELPFAGSREDPSLPCLHPDPELVMDTRMKALRAYSIWHPCLPSSTKLATT